MQHLSAALDLKSFSQRERKFLEDLKGPLGRRLRLRMSNLCIFDSKSAPNRLKSHQTWLFLDRKHIESGSEIVLEAMAWGKPVPRDLSMCAAQAFRGISRPRSRLAPVSASKMAGNATESCVFMQFPSKNQALTVVYDPFTS